jgi:hypothetical protein
MVRSTSQEAQHIKIKKKRRHFAKDYTVPKDSENFVPNNNGAGRLFSVTIVFVGAELPELSVTKFTNLLDSVS